MSDYSATFPSQRPVFSQDFAQSGKIDPRATFSRSDSPIDATKAAASAVHYWSNEKSLSSENLIINSDASDWYSPNHTTTASQTGPDGGSNATQFTEKANGSQQYKIQSGNFTPIANQEITYSVWLKQSAGSRDYQQIRVGNIGGGRAWATFNLTNGTVDQVNGNLGVTASVNTGPTGWYQCVMRFTPDSTTALSFYIYAAAASGGELPSVTGDTGNSYLLYGAQVSTTGETVVNDTSGQIHREYAPTLKSVATAGAARFEYDPVTNVSRGILIESQSSNELSYSENFDDSYWFKSDTTVQLNAGISPAGDLTADLVTADSTGSAGIHYLGKPFAFTSGNTYTFSVYVKGVNSTEFTLQGGNTSTYAAATQFTLTGAGSASSTTGSATIESVGNDWYRCSVTGDALATTSTTAMFKLISGGTGTFDGDDFSGVLLWGAQLEQSSHPSSYISTLLSAKTRAADSLSVATADIGYTGGPVSIVAEGEGGRGIYPRLFSMGDLSSYLTFFRLGSAASASTAYKFWVYDSGTQQADLNEEASVTKVAVSIDTNSVKSCGDGGAVQSDTSAVIPILTSLRIGDQPTGGKQWNGHVKRVAIYNEALTDTNLQALTS
jgi:hypothetical protein